MVARRSDRGWAVPDASMPRYTNMVTKSDVMPRVRSVPTTPMDRWVFGAAAGLCAAASSPAFCPGWSVLEGEKTSTLSVAVALGSLALSQAYESRAKNSATRKEPKTNTARTVSSSS